MNGDLQLNDGHDMPRLGIGVATLSGQQAAQVVAAALRAGCRSIDSAVVYETEEAVRTGKNNPLVRAFLAAIREQGNTPAFKVKTGTSDMNVVAAPPTAAELAAAWTCPMLAYGPGDSALDHTPHEHIDLREYGRAIAVLAATLRSLLS